MELTFVSLHFAKIQRKSCFLPSRIGRQETGFVLSLNRCNDASTSHLSQSIPAFKSGFWRKYWRLVPCLRSSSCSNIRWTLVFDKPRIASYTCAGYTSFKQQTGKSLSSPMHSELPVQSVGVLTDFSFLVFGYDSYDYMWEDVDSLGDELGRFSKLTALETLSSRHRNLSSHNYCIFLL